jgi:hypothetical protein
MCFVFLNFNHIPLYISLKRKTKTEMNQTASPSSLENDLAVLASEDGHLLPTLYAFGPDDEDEDDEDFEDEEDEDLDFLEDSELDDFDTYDDDDDDDDFY